MRMTFDQKLREVKRLLHLMRRQRPVPPPDNHEAKVTRRHLIRAIDEVEGLELCEWLWNRGGS